MTTRLLHYYERLARNAAVYYCVYDHVLIVMSSESQLYRIVPLYYNKHNITKRYLKVMRLCFVILFEPNIDYEVAKSTAAF